MLTESDAMVRVFHHSIKDLKFDRISFLISTRMLSRISVFIALITESQALSVDTKAFENLAFAMRFLQAVHSHTKCIFAAMDACTSFAIPEHRKHTVEEQNPPHFTESPSIALAHFSHTPVIMVISATLDERWFHK